MKKIFLLNLMFLLGFALFGQEFVIDCGNPTLQNYSVKYFDNNSNKTARSLDTLSLPFFDDFSHSYIYPDSTRWVDKYVYINNTYATNKISYGVATFDALDQYGYVYLNLPAVQSDLADMLTSVPINMNYQPSDSIYLSFYYQCGGSGNSPEENDSLVLQFYSVENQSWRNVWSKSGGSPMTDFKLVMIPIVDSLWLQKGFQFRFMNYASISSNYEPSWQSNVDQWNLDFVLIEPNRTMGDTIIHDVAMTENVGNFLNTYTTIPWNHLKASSRDIFNDSISFVYRNLDNQSTNNINRQYIISNARDNSAVSFQYDDSDNIDPLEVINYTKRLGYYFNESEVDSAKFIIRKNIKTDNTEVRELYRWNDTVRYYQNFINYYAYDDGSAEKGYGITGQGTANSSLAYRFTPYAADSLYGVYIYFNNTQNDDNVKYFYLTVWNNNVNEPGEPLVRKIGVKPAFNGQINGYVYYPFDTAVYISGTFYVGWTKTTDDMLNCGLDVENDAHDNIFYNVTGSWVKSSISGALMIRPVFGYEIRSETAVEPIESLNFDVYPNPVSDILKISTDKDISTIRIYDVFGNLIFIKESEKEINVADLPQGTYFLRIEFENKSIKTQKVIVLR